MTNDFLTAYFRLTANSNIRFSFLVNATPLANVARFGSAGYFQEFTSVANSNTKLALVLPSLAASGTQTAVFQVLAGMYSYYSGVGVNTAGYPTIDTQACPAVNCLYQLFSNNTALFYYASGNPNGQGISLSGTAYTLWTSLGGINSVLGPAYDVLTAVTSPFKTTANQQVFTGGTIYAVTSGLNNGTAFAVAEPGFDLYRSLGGATGSLGLPTSSDLVLADGSHRQNFEGGRIVYASGGSPAIQFTVGEIDLTPAGPLNLSYGQTTTVTVTLFDSQGAPAVGRLVSWSTSNSSAVSIAPSGSTATLKAAGAGTAQITATSEGLVSKKLMVTVTAPCCQIGEGAPTSAIQQAFQDAVSRNRLVVLLPAANPVRRAGTGYLQDLSSPDGTLRYLVAKSDTTVQAFVVSLPVLPAYSLLGGATGALGYPLSDYVPAGRQLFEGGALAGNPLQLVSGAILSKWTALNYELGAAGLPSGAAVPFTSRSGYSGATQAFAGGMITGIASGSLAGQAYLVMGPLLDVYRSAGGPGGELGLPLTDQFAVAGGVRQNFENGTIDFFAGAASATEHLTPPVPAITANPASILAGSRLHLAITGFSDGAKLRVSITGQPDFQVTAVGGGYSWDVFLPAAAPSATVALKAVDTGSSATATGSYTVRSLASAQPQLLKAQGDNQSGAPGITLATPLTIVLTDGNGIPLSGASVAFSASPGAVVAPASALTDSAGRASTALRLPPGPGIAAVTAQALGQIAIFNAQAKGSFTLNGFPQFLATTPTGAQVAAAAAILRYYQNQGALPTANGPATGASLDAYLAAQRDGYLSAGPQLVNFWRLAAFTGGNVSVSVESAGLDGIRAGVAGGDPVLLSLALTQDGLAVGGTTVVGTGIAAEGSVSILDPNPLFARGSLSDYLTGFSANGHTYRATLVSALRLLPQGASAMGFVFESLSQPAASLPTLSASSRAGSCGAVFQAQDPFTGTAPTSILASQLLYCDGSQDLYQAGLDGQSPLQGALLDLAMPGAPLDVSSPGPSAFQISRNGAGLAVSAPQVAFTPESVLNAASFLPGAATGGLISVFGSGLSGVGGVTTATIGGKNAALLLASPFQLNLQVPEGLAPGDQPLTVSTASGTLTQSVFLQTASPGIFLTGLAGDGKSQTGTVFNQDGSLNGMTSPARRGSAIVIYATGLGATVIQSKLAVTTGTVTATLSGTVAPVLFAGLTPGFLGLYQVNVQVPTGLAPGLFVPLVLQEGSGASNSVVVAVQ